MDKNYPIQLTQDIYRLTLFFPKKEPLRYKMREVADDILTNFYKEQNLEIFKNLEILDGFFEVAKVQNWISPNEILKLQKECSKLKEDLVNVAGFRSVKEEAEKINEPEVGSKDFPQRQKEILKFLKEKGRAQVWELKQIFPEVSKRTLRRDFEQLLNLGAIERIGERNQTFYMLRGRA